MIHKDCDTLADMMRDEIIKLERVIKAYRGMLIAMNMAPTILDKIEDDAYNSK